MSELPSLTGKDVVRALRRLGFVVLRQKGSHVVLAHLVTKQRTVVPIHPGKDIKKPLLKSIITDDVGMTVETFLQALRKRN